MISHRRFTSLGICALLAGASLPAGAKITIQLDYSLDANGFFTINPAAKTVLDLAVANFSDRFRDTLDAITPGDTGFGFSNTWDANFNNPATGAQETVTDLTIPKNTIKVYAGARVLGGTTLGIGGPGGYGASGTQEFLDTVGGRGQPTAANDDFSTRTDFGPWGGAITFDTTTNWSFLLGSAPPAGSGKSDFYSVALHEMAHLLGFGTADSFANRIVGGKFVGPAAGTVSVSPDQGHWAAGTKGNVGAGTQDADMTPSITQGTRKRFTSIDWAGMSDLGWQLARPGDANADGTVDFNDLVALAQNYNVADAQHRWSQGDFNYDGNVDFSDLVLLAQNYNTSEAAPIPADSLVSLGASFASEWQAAEALASVSAPEPGSIALLAIALLPTLTRRRR